MHINSLFSIINKKTRNNEQLGNLHECNQNSYPYQYYYSKIIVPYNKTIIDIHGGKYWLILTPYLVISL